MGCYDDTGFLLRSALQRWQQRLAFHRYQPSGSLTLARLEVRAHEHLLILQVELANRADSVEKVHALRRRGRRGYRTGRKLARRWPSVKAAKHEHGSGDVGSQAPKALITVVAQLVGCHVAQRIECFEQGAIEYLCGLVMILVGSTRWFFDDAVDDAQLEQEGGGDLQASRCGGSHVSRVVENGCATFGRDHRVVAELEHEDAIGNTKRQRTTRTAFTNDGGHYGHTQAGHHLERCAN